MPPKGGNAKKESGRAKKAENEAKKRTATEEAKVRQRQSATTLIRHTLSNEQNLLHRYPLIGARRGRQVVSGIKGS